MRRKFLSVVFLLLSLAGLVGMSPAQAQTPCTHRLFVSGYFSTVHVYDACTGQFLRELDSRARLEGAQAIRVGPDGLVYVVSEQQAKIHKYRADTMAYVGLYASPPLSMAPLSIDFASDGTAYVAGYESNDVKKFDRNGNLIGNAFASGASGIAGPEIGSMFGPDGNFYVPGYNSHSMIKFDPRTNQTSVAVAPRAGGIFRPRGLLLNRERTHFFLSVEGSGQIMRYRIADGALTEFRRGLIGATMMAYAPDGKLLVVNNGGVDRIDPDTGTTLNNLVPPGSGGLSGATFIAVVPVAAANVVDTTQVGTQYWVVGDAKFSGNMLDIPVAYTGTGTSFGPTLKFSEITAKRWGTVRIELLSCTRARFSWDSTGTNSGNFGAGNYEIQRLFANEADDRCTQRGFEHADKSWVSGHWWGGDARSGEGVFLDRRSDNTTFFSWFTHRPSAAALPATDTSMIGTQFWLVADGKFAGDVLEMSNAYTGTGTSFGPTLKFSEITAKRWGTIRIELTSCTQAKFSWDSTGTSSGGFGSGSYDVQRLFSNESTERCLQQGFANADRSWVNGHWWGGDTRSGEGWFLDRRADGTAFFAWFTHRPL
jgi:hypothetical protein